MTVTGIDEVTGRLQAVMHKLRKESSKNAVDQFLLAVQAYSMRLTPVDTSTLINSLSVKVQPLSDGWRGTVFYGAKYAKWVHAMPGTLKGQPRADFGTTRQGIGFGGGTGVGNYWGPNGEPGFLRKGVERARRDDLPGIIKRNFEL